MNHFKYSTLAFLLILFLSACLVQSGPPVEDAIVQTPTAVETAPATGTPSVEAPSATAAAPTPASSPKSPSTPAEATAEPSPEPLPAVESGSKEMSAGAAVSDELARTIPPERDDRRLAIAFRGLDDGELPPAPVVSEPLAPGMEETFTIPNIVDNTVSQIDAALLAVSDYAYFWFDQGPGASNPAAEDLTHAAAIFDVIYEVVVEQFGPESNPGIDGDTRLHIVNASPIALCGVTEQTLDRCTLAGLVNSIDLLPAGIDPRSNEREMFVMNANRFGTDYYLGVLAHEFRHMIEDRYDKSDSDWEVEGSATLAAQLTGLPSGGVERGNLFLENPDQQLNAWVDEGTASYYGQGYLLNRFLYDQLGPDLYREFATSPLPGFHAVDAVAAANRLERDGQSLWLDYLVALAIHNVPQADARYKFQSDGLETAAMTAVNNLPASYEETVAQFAADYYELPPGIAAIDFSGSPSVALLGVDPPAGERYWFAQRANYSNPRLTYALDLRDLDSATLSYDVFSDIEQGYDFAYVSVSVDDGLTWLPLEAGNMQGAAPEDNPAGSAFTDHFYTGRRLAWVTDTVDLSPYAGRAIVLRFEYVTDPILTYGGFALDNIAIPELDFFDGAEEAQGQATAEGFIRATADIPQAWHLQHITLDDGVPEVNFLSVDDQGKMRLDLGNESGERSIIIVAAAAPTTLERAAYQLRLEG